MKQLKTALFDLDGTLFDTEGQYTRFWSQVGEAYFPQIPDFAQRIKGTTLKQMSELYFTDPALQREIVAQLNVFEANMTYNFFPGAIDFLASLKANHVQCAVVTSSNLAKMECVARQLPEFSSLFDRILTAEDFVASKPHPDCYLKAAAAFHCALDECVVFEDALVGLQAGVSSGIFTIGLPNTLPRELIADRCHYVLDGYEGFTFDRLCTILHDNRPQLSSIL